MTEETVPPDGTDPPYVEDAPPAPEDRQADATPRNDAIPEEPEEDNDA